MAVPVLGWLWRANKRVVAGIGERIAAPDPLVQGYLELVATLGNRLMDDATLRWDHDRRTLFVTDTGEAPDSEAADSGRYEITYTSLSYFLPVIALLYVWGLFGPVFSLPVALLVLSVFHGTKNVLGEDDYTVDYTHVQCAGRDRSETALNAEAAD
jgi:hypothetical protein